MIQYIGRKMPTLLNISEVIYCQPLTIKSDFKDVVEHHNFWEFTYVVSGKVRELSAEKEYELESGEVYFHKPNEPHCTNPSGKGDALVYFISFKADSKIMYLFDNLKMKLSEETAELLSKAISIAHNTYIDNSVFDSHKKCVNMKPADGIPTGNQQLYKNYLEIFIIKIIQYIESKYGDVSYDSKEDFDKAIYKKILGILNDSIYSDFTIDYLCDKLNYSKTYLFNIFKKYSDNSIIQQYNLYKIEEAKRLLSDTDIPVYNISNRLKYCSPYYFSNTFKKITGMSPVQYRKNTTQEMQ